MAFPSSTTYPGASTFPGDSAGTPATTGLVAAALPALSAAAAGTVTLPAASGSVSGTLPSLTASIAGTHSSNDQAGATAVTLPALQGSVDGTYTPAPVDGSVTVGLPSLTASAIGDVVTIGSVVATLPPLEVAVNDGSGDAAGVVGAVLPPLSVGVVGYAPASLGPWTVEQSQGATVGVVPPDAGGVGGPLYLQPAIAAAPATIVERPIVRASHLLPTPAPDADGRVRLDGTHDIVTETYGTPHLFVSGVDVTYFRDVPVQIGEWKSSQPGGDEYASVDFPQLSSFDVPGVGDLWWLRADHQAEIAIVKPDGTRGTEQFAGYLVSNTNRTGEGALEVSWALQGTFGQVDHQMRRTPTFMDATDIGTVIPNVLNSVTSRQFPAIPKVTTGIFTRKLGSYSDTEWDYCQDLLGTSWFEEGGDLNQWTLSRTDVPRQYVMAVKDITTVHWTVTNGTPGVDVQLTADQATVCDALYGRGVNPDGYAWAGWVYPNLHPDNAPSYPFASSSSVMTIGTTDGSTSSGSGVSDFQSRAVALGLKGIEVSGTFEADDAEAAREIQRRYGLSVDGVVGPQTWTALFSVGSNVGSLDGAYRRPLDYNPVFEPNLFNGDGSIAGRNPSYEAWRIRRERFVDYGSGITRAEATRSARLQRRLDSKTNAWTGTITFTTDPEEGCRFDIFEGHNIRLKGWRGTTVLLHVVEVTKDPNNLTVTVTVDTNRRDAMTLSAIRERDREAAIDPARRPGSVNRSSRQATDTVVEFDGESGAGFIPKFATYGGLWSVVRIPVSQTGRVAMWEMSSRGPKSEIFCAMFGAPIQPSHLVKYVGNPKVSSDGWKRNRAVLEDTFGWIEGVGSVDEPGGYWPELKSDGAVLTGDMKDTGGFEYVSTRPPWIWVAVWTPVSTFVSGRILPAPVT